MVTLSKIGAGSPDGFTSSRPRAVRFLRPAAIVAQPPLGLKERGNES